MINHWKVQVAVADKHLGVECQEVGFQSVDDTYICYVYHRKYDLVKYLGRISSGLQCISLKLYHKPY